MLPRGPHIRWHAGRVLAFGLGEVSLQFGRKEIVFSIVAKYWDAKECCDGFQINCHFCRVTR